MKCINNGNQIKCLEMQISALCFATSDMAGEGLRVKTEPLVPDSRIMNSRPFNPLLILQIEALDLVKSNKFVVK